MQPIQQVGLIMLLAVVAYGIFNAYLLTRHPAAWKAWSDAEHREKERKTQARKTAAVGAFRIARRFLKK